MLSPRTKVFAVKDCKLFPILSDVEGGTTEYGEPVDVPGIKSVAVTGDVAVVTLEGDNQPMDSDSTITGVKVSIGYAKLSLEVLSLLMGGPVVQAGTTPAQRASWKLKGGTTPSKPLPFKLEAVSVSADPVNGNSDLTLFRVQLSSFPELGLVEKDYKLQAVEGTCTPRLSDGDWVEVGINETARVIGAPAA